MEDRRHGKSKNPREERQVGRDCYEDTCRARFLLSAARNPAPSRIGLRRERSTCQGLLSILHTRRPFPARTSAPRVTLHLAITKVICALPLEPEMRNEGTQATFFPPSIITITSKYSRSVVQNVRGCF